MTQQDLISRSYLEEQKRLHADPRGYGRKGKKWAPTVLEVADLYRCTGVLDYGCGGGSLGLEISDRVDMSEYDPAINGKDRLPKSSPMVVCTDVLEHIESDKIDAVLRHLHSLTERVLFAVVALVEASKYLTDGRQAHILLRSAEWWRYQFEKHGFVIAREIKGKEHKQLAVVLVRRQA